MKCQTTRPTPGARRSMPVAAWALAVGQLMAGAAEAHGDQHEHGVVHLDMALQGAQLELQLVAPLDSVLGFERQPRSDAERQQVQQVLRQLRDAARLFQLPAAAACQAQDVQLQSVLMQAQPAPSGSAPPGPAHLDIDVTYRFQCRAPQQLGRLSQQLFAQFPRIQRIEVQWASEQGQGRQQLRRPQSQLIWR